MFAPLTCERREKVTPIFPKATSIQRCPCVQTQHARVQPCARAPPASHHLGHLPTATQRRSRAPREGYSTQPQRASFFFPPPPHYQAQQQPTAQTKRRQHPPLALPADQARTRTRERTRPRARPHAAHRVPGATRAVRLVGAGAGPCLREKRLGRAIRARACGGLGRMGAGCRFGALGAHRFGLHLGDGLCGLGRGARCGGGSVKVDLSWFVGGNGE